MVGRRWGPEYASVRGQAINKNSVMIPDDHLKGMPLLLTCHLPSVGLADLSEICSVHLLRPSPMPPQCLVLSSLSIFRLRVQNSETDILHRSLFEMEL